MRKIVRFFLLLALVASLFCWTVQAETGRPDAIRKLLAKTSETSREEVVSLLELSDDQLLEAISRKAFDYFWLEANPRNGLIKDRSTPQSPCSIAAVGFGLTAIPVAVERGWISYADGYKRALTTLKTFAGGKVEGRKGFYYHFVDMHNGKRVWNSELSSIDTAILIAGGLVCGEYFKETSVEKYANKLYEKVDWQWMTNGEETLTMGWDPLTGFLHSRWNGFNEGILAALLAIGSPTHPLSPEAWQQIYRPVKNGTYINLQDEVLFVYQYPLIWFDLRDKEDYYANYWQNAIAATNYNRLFTTFNKSFATYQRDIWGLSAGDGPTGYKAYGAFKDKHDGTIIPYASVASLPFTAEESMKAIRGMLDKFGPLVWRKYGFVSGFNVDRQWFSSQHIGIDQGDMLLMIENYRTGMIWEYFMRHPSAQKALKLAGFVDSTSEYAVTPAYAVEYETAMLLPSQKKAEAPRVRTTVLIDGDLSEWQGIPSNLVDEDMNVPDGNITKVDKSKMKLHSYFYSQWDDECLYLAAEVTDDIIVNNLSPAERGSFYRSDSIEFYIDPGRSGGGAGLFKLAVLPFDTLGNTHGARHEDARPGPIEVMAPKTKIAARKTATGYNVEVSIPFEYLGVTPESGLVLGFCHTVINCNDRGAPLGAYVRENMIAWNHLPSVWSNPDYWGELVLK